MANIELAADRAQIPETGVLTCARRFDTVEHMFDATDWNSSADAEIARLQSGVAELSMENVADWHGDALSDRLVALLEVRERLDAELTRTAAVWSRRRAWEADGVLSPTAWLTHRAPLGRRDAWRIVKAARAINVSSHLADSLKSGELTASHVGALAAVVSPRRESLLADHGELLAKQGKRLTIEDFTLLARRWASMADDQLAADSHQEVEPPHNEVRAAVTMDGRVVGDFDLDAISGAELLGALDHIEPPDAVDAPEGPRSLKERRGDALAELVSRYHNGDKPGANPPNLDVVVDVATLAGAPPDLAKKRCDLEGVGPIVTATLEQLKCGATMRRLVMAGDSIVLDMGRKTRFATPAQTRAVRTRDGGCIFPGCGRPPRWCDIHHIDDWASGGHTDVPRMCCLCRRHHTLIHNSRWSIVVEANGSFRLTHPIRAP